MDSEDNAREWCPVCMSHGPSAGDTGGRVPPGGSGVCVKITRSRGGRIFPETGKNFNFFVVEASTWKRVVVKAACVSVFNVAAVVAGVPLAFIQKHRCGGCNIERWNIGCHRDFENLITYIKCGRCEAMGF